LGDNAITAMTSEAKGLADRRLQLRAQLAPQQEPRGKTRVLTVPGCTPRQAAASHPGIAPFCAA